MVSWHFTRRLHWKSIKGCSKLHCRILCIISFSITSIIVSICNFFFLLGFLYHIKSEASHAFLGTAGLIPFDPPSPARIIPPVLEHVLEVDDVEGARDEQLASLLLPGHGCLYLNAGPLVILPPTAPTLVEPLA